MIDFIPEYYRQKVLMILFSQELVCKFCRNSKVNSSENGFVFPHYHAKNCIKMESPYIYIIENFFNYRFEFTKYSIWSDSSVRNRKENLQVPKMPQADII